MILVYRRGRRYLDRCAEQPNVVIFDINLSGLVYRVAHSQSTDQKLLTYEGNEWSIRNEGLRPHRASFYAGTIRSKCGDQP